MHAHALEVLSPAIPMDGGRVLDVGVGSGYLAAALSRMVGAGGVVYGLVRQRNSPLGGVVRVSFSRGVPVVRFFFLILGRLAWFALFRIDAC